MQIEAQTETPASHTDPFIELIALSCRFGGEKIDEQTQLVRTQIQSLLNRIDETLKHSSLVENRFPVSILSIKRSRTNSTAWQIELEVLPGNPLYTAANLTRGVFTFSIEVIFGERFGKQLTEDGLLSAINKAFKEANQIETDFSMNLFMSQAALSTNGTH